MKIKLSLLRKYKFEDKFKIFYRFRFDKDYLKYNIDKRKFSRKSSKIWYKNNYKKKKLFGIFYRTKIIGLIIYNIDNFFYSITLSKSFRSRGIGKIALNKFIQFLVKKRKKLNTIINKKNIHSIRLHEKICKRKKNFNKNFYYFKIL
jgi:RimJ/RimL family protein N-acetyltransferase